jgi:hypothetical protein
VTRGRADTPAPTASALARATERERRARARLAELEYQRKVGQLIPAGPAELRWSERVVTMRDRFLTLATRIRQRYPEIGLAVAEGIDAMIREDLETLADGARGDSGGDARAGGPGGVEPPPAAAAAPAV